jgi:hypothetical protein
LNNSTFFMAVSYSRTVCVFFNVSYKMGYRTR